jgi:hypothetical protein
MKSNLMNLINKRANPDDEPTEQEIIILINTIEG